MHCRKNFLDLSDDERTWLADAFNAIFAAGVIEDHAHHHDEYFFNGIHFGPAFLPWHRHMLKQVEQALQAVDDRVMLPYWDWTRAADSQDLDAEPWLSFFGGRAGKGRFPGWNFTRAAAPIGSLPTLAAVTAALGQGAFVDFRGMECGIHSAPHIWVGETMAGGHSPRDPLFYLHHCNIDRLWAVWQLNHPAATQYSLDSNSCDSVDEAFVALNDPMVGGATPASMLDHGALGYSYPKDDLLPATLVTGDGVEMVLQTPQIIFNSVPEGDTTKRAALFKVTGCEGLTFEVASGPSAPFSLYAPGPYPYPQATGLPTEELRIWVLFTGGTPGSVDAGTMTVVARNAFGDEVRRFENIPILAYSVARPRVAVALVLDESGSMLYDAGYGRTRLQVLQLAATTFVDQLYDDNGLAMVSFANSSEEVMDLQVAGDLASGVRTNARSEIAAHGPPDVYQHTSIGSGLQAAADVYATSPISSDFAIRSTVVFTDGFEDRSPWIGEVGPLVNERVYAVGVADAANVANETLREIADGTGGFMLVTGAIAEDDQFLLEKFFIQVLAGVTNRDIVRDPDGWLVPGQIAKVPFSIARSDIAFDAVALSRAPHYVVLALEAPDGTVIGPGQVAPGALRTGSTSRAYRVTLPIVVDGREHWAGEWELLLALAGFGDVNLSVANVPGFGQAAALPYHAVVHARSNLHLAARIAQSGLAPGSQLHLRGVITEYGEPIETHPTVVADLVRPDGTTGTLTLSEVGTGEFEASLTATQAGPYRFLVRASGFTGRGDWFTREQLLTAVVGTHTPPPPGGGGAPGAGKLCEFLECLLRSGAVSKELLQRIQRMGLDVGKLKRCMHRVCEGKKEQPTIG